MPKTNFPLETLINDLHGAQDEQDHGQSAGVI